MTNQLFLNLFGFILELSSIALLSFLLVNDIFINNLIRFNDYELWKKGIFNNQID